MEKQMDTVDLENAKLHKESWGSVARKPEGKNGSTKCKGNKKV